MSPVPDPSENHHNSIDELEIGNYVINIVAPGSSSEEEESFSTENGGYQPLPQVPDNLSEDEEAIDYSSISGILSALNCHGPQIIDGVESIEEESNNNNFNSSEDAIETCNKPLEGSSLQQQFDKEIPDGSRLDENVYAKEQAILWKSSKGNEIQIDEGKENEIKLLMSKITLPSSAIPPWAKEISEEDWKTQVSSRIFGSDLAKNIHG